MASTSALTRQPTPVIDWFARQAREPPLRDPMHYVDLLLLEDLMLRQKSGSVSRGHVIETASILAVLLCLIGIIVYATSASTTVVVASPPATEAPSPLDDAMKGP